MHGSDPMIEPLAGIVGDDGADTDFDGVELGAG
jgi:hypothetical protein